MELRASSHIASRPPAHASRADSFTMTTLRIPSNSPFPLCSAQYAIYGPRLLRAPDPAAPFPIVDRQESSQSSTGSWARAGMERRTRILSRRSESHKRKPGAPSRNC